MGLDQKIEMSLLVIVVCGVAACNGAVYKVGDAAGWTVIGNIDYDKWASSKTFRVGDILVFEYNNQFHNVKQVNLSDYRSCNPDNPIATFSSGNDSYTINSPGHYYFLCGFPGHCQAGQRVNIRIPRNFYPMISPSREPYEPATALSPLANGPVPYGPSLSGTPSPQFCNCIWCLGLPFMLPLFWSLV